MASGGVLALLSPLNDKAVDCSALTWTEFALASVIVFVGSTLQASVGFGMGLLASPVLILLDSRFVPGPILFATLVLTMLLTYREHYAIDLHGLRWAIVGRLAGTFVAALVFLVLPDTQIVTLFGAFILLGVAMSLAGIKLRPVRPVLLGAGALSGIMGTFASVGGPPMALIYQDAPGARIRSTMSSFFLIGTIVSLFALWIAGRFGVDEMRLAVTMVPGLIAGYVTSRWTTGIVDRGYTRRAVLSVATASGVVVIARQFF